VTVARRLVIALIPAVVLLAPLLAHAQEPAAPTLTVNQVDASNYPSVRTVVTVLDARGVPVQGLVPAQFQAFEGQDQLTISSVQAAIDEQQPLSVIVVIDVSGSMSGDRIGQAKQAATSFVQSLGAGDEAAVLSFSDEVRTVVPLTGDRLQLTNGIAGLQAAGGTGLYDAVQVSAYAAASAESPRSAVVLLTDGENETQASDATRDGSLAIARGAGVPLFTIGVGETTDEPYLQELAASTAGRYMVATPESVAGVYGDIATLLRNQYVVTIEDAHKADGSEAGVQLVALVGNETAGAVLTYKRGASLAPPQARITPAASASPAGSTSSSNDAAYIFGAAVVLVALAIGGVALFRWQRHQRLLRKQMKIIEPNVQLASAQPLPARHGPVIASPAVTNGGSHSPAEVGTGRLMERDGDRVFELGGGPAVIGTSPRLATIVLNGGDVAPEHTRIWLRDGRYLLHHVGGMSRKTLVGGKEADWVVLEPGDELTIGPWRLVFDMDHPDEDDEKRLIRMAREREAAQRRY
jgi:VWFA-related protein